MSSSSRAHIRIVQVTDIYTLANFPSLKTLIQEKKAEVEESGGMAISMLTGDFLAPYLLSSFDKGVGMMSMLNKTPIDYVIWGNHEHGELGNNFHKSFSSQNRCFCEHYSRVYRVFHVWSLATFMLNMD